MKRRKAVMPPPPTINEAIDRTMPSADRSCLPLRPYARFYDGIGWIMDAVTECSIEYNGHPVSDEPMQRYDVTVMPARYFA